MRVLTLVMGLILGGLPAHPALADVAFRDVTVLPMDAQRVLEHQTVLVRDGRILAIGPATAVSVPDDATVIDGKGKFLMPGLADMHVHTWDPNDMKLFLANGVTTVRNLFGAPLHLAWQRNIETGKLLGPRLYTASTILDGKPSIWPSSVEVENAEQAEAAVRRLHEAGYGWLKVYSKLTPEAFHAALATAQELGLPVTGHIPIMVDLADAIDAGITCIEHLSGYYAALQKEDSPFRSMGLEQRGAADYRELLQTLSDNLDLTRLAQVVRRTRSHNVWNVPTLLVLERMFASAEDKRRWFNGPRMKYVNAFSRNMWNPANDFRLKEFSAEEIARARAGLEAYPTIAKALHDGGCDLMLGTDTPNPFVYTGFSAHEELDRLVNKAGLTPYQALRTATANPARFLDERRRFGTVAAGLEADLLLLEADPFEDIANTTRIAGVMTRGRWLDRKKLDAMLAEVATANGGGGERDKE